MSLVSKNLFNGEELFSAPYLTLNQAMASLQKAHTAYTQWSLLPLDARIAHVKKGIDYFKKNQAQIALDVCNSVGKPLSQSLQEVEVGIYKMQTLCSLAPEALRTETHFHADSSQDIMYEVRRVPKGVIDIIVPWNYPVFTALNAIIPALLAGNTVGLKHESTPLIGEHFHKAFGTARLMQDGKEVVIEGLVEHLLVSISVSNSLLLTCDFIHHRVFTGSVGAGRAINKLAGERSTNEELENPFISTSLELGGSDGSYVSADADLQAACPFVVDVGRLHNAGQSCASLKRLFVHESVFPQVSQAIIQRMGEKVLGDPKDEKTTIGPLFGGAKACEGLLGMVWEAQEKGAKVFVEGKDVSAKSKEELKSLILVVIQQGHFFKPTVLTNVTMDMRVMKEETFGPILPIMSVKNDEEALARLNESKFGLTQSVWTKSRQKAEYFIQRANSGTVFVNWCNDVHPHVVWSGVKWSGNGIGAVGTEGFRTLTYPKSVVKFNLNC